MKKLRISSRNARFRGFRSLVFSGFLLLLLVRLLVCRVFLVFEVSVLLLFLVFLCHSILRVWRFLRIRLRQKFLSAYVFVLLFLDCSEFVWFCLFYLLWFLFCYVNIVCEKIDATPTLHVKLFFCDFLHMPRN